jgi:hypothetical protein
MSAVVAVLNPEPMPVDCLLEIALVLDVEDDLRVLLHLEGRPGYRTVLDQHPHPAAAKVLGHWGD